MIPYTFFHFHTHFNFFSLALATRSPIIIFNSLPFVATFKEATYSNLEKTILQNPCNKLAHPSKLNKISINIIYIQSLTDVRKMNTYKNSIVINRYQKYDKYRKIIPEIL